MQERLSFSLAKVREEEREGTMESERERERKWRRTALSSKSSCDCRRNAVTAEGEDVKTNWIFASVTSFFADNSDFFLFADGR